MKNTYVAKKTNIVNFDKHNNLLRLKLSPGNNSFQAGQFFIIGIPGYGEAPFTPINYPQSNFIEFLIKKTGALTDKLFQLKRKDTVMVRGPYGNHFPFSQMSEKNIILIAGGCGIAPISSALYRLDKNYTKYPSIKLFYGVNTPEEIIFKKELEKLSKNIEILITVANPNKKYHGNVGYVDKLLSNNTIEDNTIAILCGPPTMYDSVLKKLLCLNLEPKNIFLQLERRMHCGTGNCQHCSCGDKLVCKDGPIFSYKELINMNTKI